MHTKTVRKASEFSPAKASVGPITKGSSGRPKGATTDGKRGSAGSGTRANRTTSTNFPQSPVPQSFLNKLGELHTAERELTLALPLIVKAAKGKDLKRLLQIHLTETKGHLRTLEAVAKSLGADLPTKGCKPVTKLIAEGVKVIGKRLVTSNQDRELIAVGQKIEQFEIGAYEELCAAAQEREYTHELALLTSILGQEKLANDLLAGLIPGTMPLKNLVEKASLQKAGAKKSR